MRHGNEKIMRSALRLSRTTIYRRMGQGTFPKPVVISEACVRWRQSDVAASPVSL